MLVPWLLFQRMRIFKGSLTRIEGIEFFILMSWVWTTIRIEAWMPINDYSHLVFCTSDINPLTYVGLCAPLSWTIPKMSLLPDSVLAHCDHLILLLLLCFKSAILYFFARFYVSYTLQQNISPEVCFHLLLIWDLQISVQLKSLTSSKILRIATQYPIVTSIWPVWITFPDLLLFLSSLSPLRTEHRNSLL